MRPMIALVGALFLVTLLAGCIGGDEAKVEAPPAVLTETIEKVEKEITFTLDDVAFSPVGVFKKESRANPRSFPFSLIPGGEPEPKWRLVWNITGLVPVGVGEKKNEAGEVFYQSWIGRPDSDGKVTWERASASKHVAVNGTMNLATAWETHYREYTAIRITLETNPDTTQEIPIMEALDGVANEEGEWGFTDLKPFAPSFGDGKAIPDLAAGKVTITFTAFALPEARAYDAFILKTDGTTERLGRLETDATGGTYGLTKSLPAANLTSWSLFVSIEDPVQKDKLHQPSAFIALKSKFKA